jgi:hypothetical protein
MLLQQRKGMQLLLLSLPRYLYHLPDGRTVNGGGVGQRLSRLLAVY